MRKRFRFSLERLLGLRRLEEKMLRAELALAQGRLREAEESKARSERYARDCQEALSMMRSLSPIPVADCLQAEALAENLLRTIRHKERTIALRQAETEKARGAYLASSSRRMAIEKLRERRFSEHRKENQKSENMRFDALASERAHRHELEGS